MKRVSIFGTTKTIKMSNKTAVELLVDSLPLRIQNMYASEIENAKAIEKDQMKHAFDEGSMYDYDGGFEEYYEEFYGK
jgi:hypothetical protein